MEPQTPPPPASTPEETPPVEAALPSEIPHMEAFTEEQQQYLQGLLAGANAGLLSLGKPGIQ